MNYQSPEDVFDITDGADTSGLYARIHARSILQGRGVPPEDWPRFSPTLSEDAYQAAHSFLLHGLNLSHRMEAGEEIDKILLKAGEFLEQLYQHDVTSQDERTRELYNAALAYYLAGYYARAYVIMKGLQEPTSYPQRPLDLLQLFFIKELPQLDEMAFGLLVDPEYSDEQMCRDLESGNIEQGEALERILRATLARSLYLFARHPRAGQSDLIEQAINLAEVGFHFALEQKLTGWWWLLYGTVALLREYQANSLWQQLEPMLEEDSSGLVRTYIRAAAERERPIIELWRSQIVALPRINESKRASYCVKMPTSAGKTRIAELAILRFLLDTADEPEKKCLYIAPYRSLAAEVEHSLQQSFNALGIRVSELYGGFDINPAETMLFGETRVFILTPEKADAFLRYKSELADQIGLVIIDEGHMISRSERGLRYEMFLNRMVRRFGDQGVRMWLMSAVMPNTEEFTTWITGQSVDDGLITSTWRASQLYLGLLVWDGEIGRAEYLYKDLEEYPGPMFLHRFVTALPRAELRRAKANRWAFPYRNNKSETIALAGLAAAMDGATLIFVPRPDWIDSVADAVLTALSLQESLAKHRGVPLQGLPIKQDPESLAAYEECVQLAEQTTGRESLIVRSLRAGFVIHHGDVPKSLRFQLEGLARQGVVQLTVATNTLAQGVNLPFRTILIHSLVQGEHRSVPATDFWNICGRAGRALHENEGTVLLLADETKSQAIVDRSREILENYVRQAQSQSLISEIRHFLEGVVGTWKETHPFADVSKLCERLAENEIDWLSPEKQRLLGTFDIQLLALLEEMPIEEVTPDAVQELFERSMFVLQLQDADPFSRLNLTEALNLIVSRIVYVRDSIPDAVSRRRFYRTGLMLADCEYLEEHRTEIEGRLHLAQDYMEWSPDERADYIVSLCENVLVNLRATQPATELRPCWPDVVRMWVLGATPDQISQVEHISEEIGNTQKISALIDDLCDYRFPWGLNALHTFFSPSEVDEDGESATPTLPEIIPYLPSLIRSGVHSPVAVILLTSGMRSRSLALKLAGRYLGEIDVNVVLSWVRLLFEQGTIHDWELEPLELTRLEEFIDRIEERAGPGRREEHEVELFEIEILNREYISPPLAGDELVAWIIGAGQLALYTRAAEYLATVEIGDDSLGQVEVEQMTATVLSVHEVDGHLQLSVLLS